jgi:hypothetical protein
MRTFDLTAKVETTRLDTVAGIEAQLLAAR